MNIWTVEAHEMCFLTAHHTEFGGDFWYLGGGGGRVGGNYRAYLYPTTTDHMSFGGRGGGGEWPGEGGLLSSRFFLFPNLALLQTNDNKMVTVLLVTYL